MKRSLTRLATAAAIVGLTCLPAATQSSGSGAGSGSSSGSGATDQQGSQPGSQASPGSAGQSTTGQGTTGQETGAKRPGDTSSTSALGQDAGKGSDADRTFLAQASAGGMAEVQFGKLASEKASNPEVKQFAQRMVTDHTKANQKLESIAKDMNFAAPHALEPEDQEAYDRISKLSGEAFDRAYVQHMVKDHQKDLQLFRKHAKSASNTEVRNFASATLPTLEKHFEQVQQLQGTVGGAKATTGTTPREKSDKTPGTTDKPGGARSTGTERPPQR